MLLTKVLPKRKYIIDALSPVTVSERTGKQISLTQALNLSDAQEFERKVRICIDHLPNENSKTKRPKESFITKGYCAHFLEKFILAFEHGLVRLS